MASILNHITRLQQDDWDYYFEIEKRNSLQNPFTSSNTYINFIRNYFARSGKIRVLETIEVDISELRFPNHICSVFFIGILIYKKTELSKKYDLGLNDPGYSTFPFIWFLITLFHDYSYSVELNSKSYNIDSLEELYRRFGVTEKLFDLPAKGRQPQMLGLRKKYFKYRLEKFNKIDHGLLAGILLYDRLVKIRREKKQYHEDDLFWGTSLEKEYELAANAISIHNIWLPSTNQHTLYTKYGLSSLISFKAIQTNDFVLFYLLGVIDTIDPIKTFTVEGFSDDEILSSIQLILKKDTVIFRNKKKSRLDFSKLVAKTNYFRGWLAIKIQTSQNQIELRFK